MDALTFFLGAYKMIDFIQQFEPATQAFVATLFTWVLTAAGAALALFTQTMDRKLMDF